MLPDYRLNSQSQKNSPRGRLTLRERAGDATAGFGGTTGVVIVTMALISARHSPIIGVSVMWKRGGASYFGVLVIFCCTHQSAWKFHLNYFIKCADPLCSVQQTADEKI